MKTTKIFLIIVLAYFTSMTANARDVDESQLLLREAMMNSNADYNKHKKKMNHEEFDRADEWGERDTQAIVIDAAGANIDGFTELKKEVGQDREVSSHYDDEYDEKMQD